MLIDGGPSGLGLARALSESMPHWDRTLDLGILSHPQEDPLGGLPEVAARYGVSAVRDNGRDNTSATFGYYQPASPSATSLHAGDAFVIDGVRFAVLWPRADYDGAELNDTSLVIRVTYGEVSFLFTGDSEAPVHRALMEGSEAAARRAACNAHDFLAYHRHRGRYQAVHRQLDPSAQTGSYNIEVEQLARAQREATSATTAPTVGEGTLTIDLGRYTDAGFVAADGGKAIKIDIAGGSITTQVGEYDTEGAFVPDEGSAKTITLSGEPKLSDLRTAINNANVGVSAQVINNGTVDQLVISSKETGAAQTFKLSGTGGLAGFSYDAGSATPGLTTVQQAKDARLVHVEDGGVGLVGAGVGGGVRW